MTIYVFSDESGVFDRDHNDIFVFGGILFFSKDEKNLCTRKYIHVVITNNYFTAGAKQAAKAVGVELWDRDVLQDKIGRVLSLQKKRT